jgi:hypothetical protein
MEQEVRDLLEERINERRSVLTQIEESWKSQARRPTAREIDRWIESGRS